MGEFIWFLLIGAVAGWLAGLIARGRGFGLAGNLMVGILGALLGGYLFRAFGYTAYGHAGAMVMAAVGSLVLLFLANLLGKPKPLS